MFPYLIFAIILFFLSLVNGGVHANLAKKEHKILDCSKTSNNFNKLNEKDINQIRKIAEFNDIELQNTCLEDDKKMGSSVDISLSRIMFNNIDIVFLGKDKNEEVYDYVVNNLSKWKKHINLVDKSNCIKNRICVLVADKWHNVSLPSNVKVVFFIIIDEKDRKTTTSYKNINGVFYRLTRCKRQAVRRVIANIFSESKTWIRFGDNKDKKFKFEKKDSKKHNSKSSNRRNTKGIS